MTFYLFLNSLFAVFILLILLSITLKVKLSEDVFILTNVMLIVIIVVIAYNYIPSNNDDLSRYFMEMNMMGGNSWRYVQKNAKYSITPTINLLMFLVSKSNHYNLLSVITVIIIFSTVFLEGYAFIYKKNTRIQTYTYFLYLFMIISVLGLINIMSGIRQPLAWLFMAIAVYNDFFKKTKSKILSIFLYLFPLTIHVSVIIVPVIRIIIKTFKKTPIMIFPIMFWKFIMPIISKVSSYLPSVFQIAIDKYFAYSMISFHNVIQHYLNNIIYIILLILSVYLFKKYKSEVNKEYLLFYIALLLFGIGSFDMFTLNSRVLDFIVLISLPLISHIPNIRNKKIRVLFMISILIFSGMSWIHQDLYMVFVS